MRNAIHPPLFIQVAKNALLFKISREHPYKRKQFSLPAHRVKFIHTAHFVVRGGLS